MPKENQESNPKNNLFFFIFGRVLCPSLKSRGSKNYFVYQVTIGYFVDRNFEESDLNGGN